MKGIIWLALALGFVCHAALATGQSLRLKGGAGALSIGYGQYDTQNLEDYLPAEFEALGQDYLQLSGYGYSVLGGRWLLGGSVTAIIGPPKTAPNGSLDAFDEDVEAAISGVRLQIEFGYLLISQLRYRLYPHIGIGGGHYELHLTSTESLTPEEIRSSTFREVTIQHGGPSVKFGVGFEMFTGKNSVDTEEKRARGLMLGARTGLVYNFFSSEGTFGDNGGGTISGGPNLNGGGFFFTLLIGGGSFRAQ